MSWLTLGSYKSSSCRVFFLPQMRHAVYPRPANNKAPPTPPTTPPIVFFAVSLRPPEPPLLPSPPDNEAGSTLVVTGKPVLPVLVICRVEPSLTVVMVVVTSWKEVVVIKVRLVVGGSDTVLVVDVSTSVVVTLPEESVEVDVEVSVVTVTEGDVVGVMVEVEDSVTTELVVAGVLVGLEVGSLEVVVSLSVTPVDRFTDWRLKRAIASSKGSAEATDADASSKPARKNEDLCMLKRGVEVLKSKFRSNSGRGRRKMKVKTRRVKWERQGKKRWMCQVV